VRHVPVCHQVVRHMRVVPMMPVCRQQCCPEMPRQKSYDHQEHGLRAAPSRSTTNSHHHRSEKWNRTAPGRRPPGPGRTETATQITRRKPATPEVTDRGGCSTAVRVAGGYKVYKNGESNEDVRLGRFGMDHRDDEIDYEERAERPRPRRPYYDVDVDDRQTGSRDKDDRETKYRETKYRDVDYRESGDRRSTEYRDVDYRESDDRRSRRCGCKSCQCRKCCCCQRC